MSDETNIREPAASSSQVSSHAGDPASEEGGGSNAAPLQDEDTAAIVDEAAEAAAAADLEREDERRREEAALQEEILDAAGVAALEAEAEALLAEADRLGAASFLAGDLAGESIDGAADAGSLDLEGHAGAEEGEAGASELDSPRAEAASPHADAASPLADAASPDADAASPHADADSPDADADSPRVDAGAPPSRGAAADPDAEMARAISEESPTAEEQLLAQAQAEVDPEADVLPAEIEELDEEGNSLEKLAAKARRLSDDQARHAIHSLLFVAEKPLTVEQLRNATGLDGNRIREALERLAGELREGISGVVLSEVGGGWQLRTAPESAEFVRRFLQIKPRRLTRAALETLAIVAYRQPVTRPEVEEIRGVDCGAVLKALLEWKLLKILGKKDEAGRPLLYGTTREFLEFFQIKDLGSLPSLREFQELNEESRQIVEEELGSEAVAEIAGTLAELSDPAFLEAERERAEKSESALADLEQAMADAEQAATEVAESLAPPKKAAEPDEDAEAPAEAASREGR